MLAKKPAVPIIGLSLIFRWSETSFVTMMATVISELQNDARPLSISRIAPAGLMGPSCWKPDAGFGMTPAVPVG